MLEMVPSHRCTAAEVVQQECVGEKISEGHVSPELVHAQRADVVTVDVNGTRFETRRRPGIPKTSGSVPTTSETLMDWSVNGTSTSGVGEHRDLTAWA